MSYPRLAVALAALVAAPPTVFAGAATIREPAFSLPHIYADTDLELARENGRQIARDRLGQLILLARVGRGTLHQAFGILDASTLNDDIETRQTGYTSTELNQMWAKLPQRERDIILEYCIGVNDTIDAVYAGTSPEPLEVSLLRFVLGLNNDLFGNATNVSDQVDPFYKAPGGADPQHPNGGFQFTPELAVSIGVLEVRNFGLGGFDEPSRLTELQALISKHGTTAGTEIWDDRNFLVDPLAPVSVPDPTTPGFGGPLASVVDRNALVRLASAFPRYDYAAGSARHRTAHERRAAFARRWGAWPMMGSYAWFIAGGKSSTGYPWLGGFPQTGIQTPSIMHFVENRSAEGADHRIQGIGMEFAGAPLVLIGQTDNVAFTTTTAQLRVVDTYFEQVVNEDTDALRYSDEGTPAPLSMRTETFASATPTTRVFWRSHERGGNKGSRAVLDFRGDAEGTVGSATANTLTKAGAFDASFAGGYVAIVDRVGAGQIRAIATADANTLTLTNPWTTVPTNVSVFVAVKPGKNVVAVAVEGSTWLEETTTVLGFSAFQRAETALDIRAGVRVIPSTHNFFAADNRAFNGIGTSSGTAGNVGYWSSGFSRIRQDATDARLPLDGTQPNPFAVASGTVASATATTVTTGTSAFTGKDFTPPPFNFRYQDPSQVGSEYIVSITSGAGYKQTRRIASNTADTLTLEAAWGVTPSVGDTLEVYEIAAIPETINPAEGYTANWNNKAATADEGENFGREFRHTFILERLAPENAWDRAKQRQLNSDLAGLDGSGKLGRFLIPRLRQAVNGVGNGGNPAVDTVLAALEAHNATPLFGRFFIDPVAATTTRGEVPFLKSLIDRLALDIYGDEYSGAISNATGSRAANIVQHAIDSAAADLPGAYTQAYSGDYFNGADWRAKIRDSLSTLAGGGIPADAARGFSRYRHPLAPISPTTLEFERTPAGNRGTYEQIIDVGPAVNGEFIFPLGQSGLIEGDLGSQTVDPHFTTLHPIWRDWRFVPMLHVATDMAGGGNGDLDGDGVLDGYERWYFGNTSRTASDDGDGDGATLLAEFQAGTDPTVADTDQDGIADGQDGRGQDRLRSTVLGTDGWIKFGDTPNTDRLKLRIDLGNGGTEFDPMTRAITLTLADDDTIYTVTIPAGTMKRSPSGQLFTLRDKTGANNGLIFARLRLGKPGKTTRFEVRTKPMDLSNAEQTDHALSITAKFGAHTVTGTSQFTVHGRLGRILRAS